MKKIFFFLLFFLVFLFISINFGNLNCDEIWNFGFSYNIYNGLVPYRDFNVLQTPFYFIFNALFFKIFSPNILVMYIINSFIITIALYFVYKISSSSFCFLSCLFLIIGLAQILYPNYNVFCMCLFIVIFYLQNKKRSTFLIGMLTGIMFITKQNIGITLTIAFIYYIFKYNKNLLNGFLGYMLPICIFWTYLIFNDALYDFINYCFLGLFDFSKYNSTYGILFCIEMFVLIYLIYKFIKDKSNRVDYLYLITFQIVVFPIFDLSHFIIANIPNIIYFVRNKNFDKYSKHIISFIVMLILFLQIFNCFNNYSSNDTKFFKYRKIDYNDLLLYRKIGNYIKDNNDIYDVHMISYSSYFVKLENEIKIDEFDLLLYGNLGYDSYNRIINEIRSSDKDILFIMNDKEFYNTQLHNEICSYIIDNSTIVGKFSNYYIYKYEV